MQREVDGEDLLLEDREVGMFNRCKCNRSANERLKLSIKLQPKSRGKVHLVELAAEQCPISVKMKISLLL